MNVRVLSHTDASFERSPGQDEDVFAANLVDERHGGPITIGYGRYGPRQGLRETMAVDDVMIVLEGQLTITANGSARTASPGDIVYMPKGEAVEIRADEEGALTAYVTWPHWKAARDSMGS
jgi:ethanolamine utilization protein EutQ (cupin superfamily)